MAITLPPVGTNHTLSTFAVRHSLATRLLRVIFGCYFAVTLIVTGVQLASEYHHDEDRLMQEMDAMEHTFGPGIADAVWWFNTEVLGGILSGMKTQPTVLGVKVMDANGQLVRGIGTILDAGQRRQEANSQGVFQATPPQEAVLFDRVFQRTFAIVYTDEHGTKHSVGWWTVYASQRTVIERLTYTLGLIVVSSIIKTLALWGIFLVVIQRSLGKPLRQLSHFVGELNLDNLADKRIELRAQGQHELHLLAHKLNHMAASLHRSVEMNATLFDELTELNGTLERQVAERTQALELLSTTDALTGLGSRRKLDAALQYESECLQRYGGTLVVIMGDMDHFKAVNDIYGHQAGDQVLCHLAGIFGATGRAVDTVGRWGGEEFMLICPNTDLQGGRALAEKLCERVAQADFPVVGHATCSFGVAELHPGEAVAALVARADAALYRAKNHGRNRVEVAID